jgi:hypothetical protein
LRILGSHPRAHQGIRQRRTARFASRHRLLRVESSTRAGRTLL